MQDKGKIEATAALGNRHRRRLRLFARSAKTEQPAHDPEK